MNTISNDPYLYTIDNFLTDKECKFIINISKANLKSAGVSTMKGEEPKYKSGSYKGRTNSSYWIALDKYPETLEIAKKVAKQIKCDYKHFESYQVIHYNESEEYKYHYDAYDITEKEKYEKFCGGEKGRGNRLRTVLVYLNDVEEGGATGFDLLDGRDEPLKVQPKMGRMVVFTNVNDDGTLNKKSRHAGLPIIKGEKWAFNLWLREQE
jgi:prolyl 4-hydroxylase